MLLIKETIELFQTRVNKKLQFRFRAASVDGSSLTSMAAEDFLINNSSNGEAVKAVSESLPQLDVEPALAW